MTVTRLFAINAQYNFEQQYQFSYRNSKFMLFIVQRKMADFKLPKIVHCMG